MLARWRATITDESGNIVPNADIEVRDEGTGSLVQLFSDRDGNNALGNPTTADGNGFIFFHVEGGAYRIDASSGGFSRTWRYVGIGRGSEFDLVPGTESGNVLVLGAGGALPAATDSFAGAVEKATEAEMEAETADKYPDASLVKHSPGTAKAWVRFVGTGTAAITEDYNVTSITDNGTGDYTFAFDTAFASSSYALAGSAERSGNNSAAILVPRTYNTGDCRIRTLDDANSAVDADTASVIWMGEQ